MSAYDIAEVQVYRIPGGALVPASDVQPLTAYQTGDGQLFETKEAARGNLVASAIHVIGSASPELVAAAAQNANSDEANLARYAILFLASVMQGGA